MESFDSYRQSSEVQNAIDQTTGDLQNIFRPQGAALLDEADKVMRMQSQNLPDAARSGGGREKQDSMKEQPKAQSTPELDPSEKTKSSSPDTLAKHANDILRPLEPALVSGAAAKVLSDFSSWKLDDKYGKLAPEHKDSMNWWKEHSPRLKQREALRTAVAESQSANLLAAQALEESKVRLADARQSVESLQKTYQTQLEANPYGHKTRQILSEQGRFAKGTLPKLRAQEIRERFGTVDEIMANEKGQSGKLFEKGSPLAEHASAYRRSTHIWEQQKQLGENKNNLDNLLDAYKHRKEMLGSISQQKKLAELHPIVSEGDWKLLKMQHTGVGELLENPGMAAEKLIGSSQDLSTFKSPFLHGSQEASIITKFQDAHLEQSNLSVHSLEAESRLLAKQQLLNSHLAEGAGKVGANRFFGSALGGMAIGLGAAAAGSAFDSAVNKSLGLKIEGLNDLHVVSDSALLPLIARAPIPGLGKAALAASIFAASRIDLIAKTLNQKKGS